MSESNSNKDKKWLYIVGALILAYLFFVGPPEWMLGYIPQRNPDPTVTQPYAVVQLETTATIPPTMVVQVTEEAPAGSGAVIDAVETQIATVYPTPYDRPGNVGKAIVLSQEAFIHTYSQLASKAFWGSADVVVTLNQDKPTDNNTYSATWSGAWFLGVGVDWNDMISDIQLQENGNDGIDIIITVSPCITSVGDSPRMIAGDVSRIGYWQGWWYGTWYDREIDYAAAGAQGAADARANAVTTDNVENMLLLGSYLLSNPEGDFIKGLVTLYGGLAEISGYADDASRVIVIVTPDNQWNRYFCGTTTAVVESDTTPWIVNIGDN